MLMTSLGPWVNAICALFNLAYRPIARADAEVWSQSVFIVHIFVQDLPITIWNRIELNYNISKVMNFYHIFQFLFQGTYP